MTDLDLLCRETVESAHMPRLMVGRFTESPRKAAEAVSERAATQSLANGPCDAVTERSAAVAPATGVAEAGVSGQPEMIPALTGQFPGANVSGPERAGVTAGRDPQPNRWASIRPHCQNPDMCPGYGDKHCSACRKLMKTSEAA